jgi:hypothetical protein
MRRFVALALLALVCWSTPGCFGTFAATRRVYAFNEEISDVKLVRTLVMYGLAIIPVYTLAMYADLLLLNVVEFWTDDNPLAAADVKGDVRVARLADGTVAPQGSVTVTRGAHRYTLVPVGEDAVEVVVDGRVLGRTRVREDGALEMWDAQGRLARVIPADQAHALLAAVAPLAPGTP